MTPASIAHYKITGKLGEGGMGVVYRAIDSKLGREVAIKILPDAFASDPDRFTRFTHEAYILASLNHPNIAAIYGIEQRALILELVEGPTLADRLARGPLPLAEALPIARQIAEALEYAHDKSVIHRDLKPANIKLTPEGRVKVLDFGLAKAASTDSSPSDPVNSPTLTMRATAAGVILGTAAYMSPEQAKGKPADRRSDIWSFGVTLFEMLTGQSPFAGETMSDTLAAVIKDQPDLARLPSTTPPSIRRLLERCLDKNPATRLQSIGEARIAIDTPAPPEQPPAAKNPTSSRLRWWALPLAAALGALAAFFLFSQPPKSSSPTFTRLTFRRGIIQAARFSPDAKSIVFAAAWDGGPVELYTAQTGSSESRPFGIPPSGLYALSPTGELAVALGARFTSPFSSVGTLAQVPLSGGAPRERFEAVADADWSPDGKELAISLNGGRRLEYPPGKAIFQDSSGPWVGHPRISPKGDLIAVADHYYFGDDGYLAIIDRQGNKKRLSERFSTIQGVAWKPDGSEIFFTAGKQGGRGTLYAVTPSGKQRLVASLPGWFTLQDISRDGQFLITRDESRRGLEFVDHDGVPPRDLTWMDWGTASALSDDGKLLVTDESGEGARGEQFVFIRKTDGSPAVKLSAGHGTQAISPDSKWVVVGENTSPRLTLVPTRTGAPRPLDLGNLEARANDRIIWTADGRWLVLLGNEKGARRRCFVQDVNQGPPRPVTPEEAIGCTPTADSRYVLARVGDRFALYPIEGGDPKPLPNLNTTYIPIRFSSDGRLFVRHNEFNKVYLDRIDIFSGRTEPVRTIAPTDMTGVRTFGQVLVTPDGVSYLYAVTRQLSDLFLIDGIH